MSFLKALFLVGVVVASAQSIGELITIGDSVEKGAVCLDGSPAAYYFREGFGDGADSWIIHMQEGGWCYDELDCFLRSFTVLGTSTLWGPTFPFGGILSSNISTNPAFYNWNMAFFRYCDGMFFSGNAPEPALVQGRNIYFRGHRILNVLLEDMLDRGMRNGRRLIFSGCCAGGQGALNLADHVRNVIPPTMSLVALSGAGMFLDIDPLPGSGVTPFREPNKYMYKMQHLEGTLNQRCIQGTSEEERWKCVFPAHLMQFVSTPSFLYNSAVDSWSMPNIYGLTCVPPNCSPEEFEQLIAYQHTFNDHMKNVTDVIMTRHGWYISSCITHCDLLNDNLWHRATVYEETAHDVFANWYYARFSGSQSLIDCIHPCNDGCVNEYSAGTPWNELVFPGDKKPLYT